MASSRKEIQQITDREIEKVNIASLADRPTSGSRYGVGDFTAQKLKERFDAFPALIKERFNAIVQALNSSDAPRYITLDGSIAGIDNLYDFLLLFCEKNAGEKNISDYIEALYTDIQNAQASSKTLQDIINDMASWLAKLKEESAVHSGKISDAEKRLDKNDERLEDIEDYINDMVMVENSNAYHVLVPKDSRSKANVLSVGGMTYKSKNLIPYPYLGGEDYSVTDRGVTFTYQKDGGIAVKGTPTQSVMLTIATSFHLKEGQTYTLRGGKDGVWLLAHTTPIGETTSHQWLESKDGSTDSKALPQGYKLYRIALYVSSVGTMVNTVIYPMINEGTTALPFEAFEGLRHTKATAIKSKGANLSPYPYHGVNKTFGVTFTDNGDGSVTANGTSTGDAAFWIVPQWGAFHLPAGTYCLSGCPSGGDSSSYRINLSLKTKDGRKILDFSDKGNGLQFTISEPSDTAFFRIAVAQGATVNNLVFKPMLNHGEEALPFEKYKEVDTITIPESMQNLEGNGLGLYDELKNTFNLEKKKYQRLVGEVDLGTLDWIYETHCFSANLSDIKPTASGDYQARKTGFLCAKYNPSSNVSYVDMDDKSILRREIKRIHIRDSAYTDAAEFKAAMAGVMLVYELADPQEIDISSLFTADNEIKVSEGGYLEFENEYQYPVPSSIEWNIYSSHKVAFEHANTVGNPHGTTAAEVGAYSISEADAKFVLLEDGKVPSRMLPSYVDDVVNGKMTQYGFQVREWLGETTFDEIDEDGFIKNPRRGVLYISDNDNGTSTVYRWSGSAFVPISNGNGIPEPVSNGFLRADYGAYTLVYGELLPDAPDLEGKIMRYVDGYWQPVDQPSSNPEVTAADNGKFLRVVDGKWSAVTIATAEGGSF